MEFYFYRSNRQCPRHGENYEKIKVKKYYTYTIDMTPGTIDSLTATNDMAVANDMVVAVGETSDDIDDASLFAKMKNSDV